MPIVARLCLCYVYVCNDLAMLRGDSVNINKNGALLFSV